MFSVLVFLCFFCFVLFFWFGCILLLYITLGPKQKWTPLPIDPATQMVAGPENKSPEFVRGGSRGGGSLRGRVRGRGRGGRGRARGGRG